MTDQSEPLFPPEVTVASFYIVRDPRDVAVSLVHHFGRSLDEVIEIMAKTDARSGQINDLTFERQLSQRLKTWSQHVSSWIDQQGVELLRYEDMISDPAGNLGRAARMLQPSISEKVILRAVEATDFGRLQAQEQRNGFVERVPGQASFFRSGRSGGWREVFSAAQANRLENDHRSIMECLGYL
jgi:aryl sulfotransferase